MPEKRITITLAEQAFEVIVPLTLGQLSDLKVAVALPSAGDYAEDIRRGDKRARDIILAALPKDFGITDTVLLGMRVTPTEVKEAVNTILIESGLIVPKDAADAPGEEKAEA